MNWRGLFDMPANDKAKSDDQVERYREIFAGDKTLSDVEASLLTVASDLGFRRFAYWVIRGPGGIRVPAINTYPEEWKHRYIEQNYESMDPTLTEASHTTLPFQWDQVRRSSRQNKQLSRFYEEANEFGVADGLTVPIHGPINGLATLNFCDPVSPDVCESVWRTRYSDLMVIGNFVHSHLVAASERVKTETIVLTPREKQVLTWTAEGKTAWEIGQILRIAEQTVLFHLKNSMQKFQVHSKTHAVVLALRNGLI